MLLAAALVRATDGDSHRIRLLCTGVAWLRPMIAQRLKAHVTAHATIWACLHLVLPLEKIRPRRKGRRRIVRGGNEFATRHLHSDRTEMANQETISNAMGPRSLRRLF